LGGPCEATAPSAKSGADHGADDDADDVAGAGSGLGGTSGAGGHSAAAGPGGGQGTSALTRTRSASASPSPSSTSPPAATSLKLLRPPGGWFPTPTVSADVTPSVGDPSPAVYPPPSLPLTFDHARHARRGIGCERCHAGARTSTEAKDDLLP